MSATLFKQPILAKLCTADSLAPQGYLDDDAQAGDMRQACRVLSAWNDTSNSDARGATLWDTFWRLLDKTPAAQLYATQFDPARPLETPSGIALDRKKIAATMGTAISAMRRAGLPIDAPHSDVVYTERNGKRIAIFGGCDDIGYFTAACALHPLDATDKQSMDGNPNGNSYLQTVYFSGSDVVADTLLAHAESDDPASSHYADATLAYSQKRWLQIPFTESQIATDPALTVQTLATGPSR
jgi:acyl-homoserine-lactone acylase